MNRDEFLEKYKSESRQFARIVEISNLDLSNINLESLHIFEGDISNNNFAYSDLRSAKFTYANLTDTNFSNANLEGASFLDGTWENTIFIGANLSESLFLNMQSINHPNFSHANCENIQVSYCDLSRANFENSSLKGALFSGQSSLSGSNCSDTCCIGLNGSGQFFVETSFDRSDLRNADFSNARLTGASFRDANLAYTDLSNADLKNADFTNANLNYTILTGANLEGAILDNANLVGSIDKKATKTDIFSLNIKSRFSPETTDPLFIDIKARVDKFYLGSDLDYPADYDTYSINNAFSLEDLFKYEGYLEPVDLNEFWHPIPNLEPLHVKQQFIQGYQALVAPIKDYLDTIEIYRLQTDRLKEAHSHTLVYLILALTKTGDWLGLSVSLDAGSISEFRSDPNFIVRDFAQSKSENLELITVLEESINNASILLRKAGDRGNFIFEYNGEISKAIWTLNETRESAFVNTILGTSHIAIVKYLSVPGIVDLEKEDGDDDDYDWNEYAGQIFTFDPYTSRLIAENFTNLRYYYVSNVHIHMYLVGQSYAGDWLVIHTSVVWA